MNHKFRFGFYKVPSEKVQKCFELCREHNINKFDTAQLYGNENACAKNINSPNETIGTKIYYASNSNKLQQKIKQSLHKFQNIQLDYILLHQIMPITLWQELIKWYTSTGSKVCKTIGVSNYDLSSLREVAKLVKLFNIKIILQIEIHPWRNQNELNTILNYCKQENILVQAHTVLTNMQLVHWEPLQILSKKYNVNAPTMLVAYALSKADEICINTSSSEHLQELLMASSLVMNPSELEEMSNWHRICEFQFYKIKNLNDINVQEVFNVLQSEKKLLDRNEYFIPDIICETLPTSGFYFKTIGLSIAQLLYPNLKTDSAKLSKYRTLIKLLRAKRLQHAEIKKLEKKGLIIKSLGQCSISKKQKAIIDGPYSDMILNPTPMPVEITNSNEFIPILQYIQNAIKPADSAKTFLRGTVFPDGRFDLCKQVHPNSEVETLCLAIQNSSLIEHFLLGNNIIFQENPIKAANAFANLIQNTKILKTLYLAGNYVNEEAIEILTKAMTTNNTIKYLWLKRNPIKINGALSIYKNILGVPFQSTVLSLLDLHNCGLTDEGTCKLFGYPDSKEILPNLHHIYLDLNAIEVKGSTAVAHWIQLANKIISLSISMNRLRDEGILLICDAIKSNNNVLKSIKRLNFGSTYMNNSSCIHVLESAMKCERLISLNLGYYKSESDLNEHSGNFYDDSILSNMKEFLTQVKSLKFFSVARSKLSNHDDPIFKQSNISIETSTLINHVHTKQELKQIKQPKCVRFIDSIYRGRM